MFLKKPKGIKMKMIIKMQTPAGYRFLQFAVYEARDNNTMGYMDFEKNRTLKSKVFSETSLTA